jgi:hypothetical protein
MWKFIKPLFLIKPDHIKSNYFKFQRVESNDHIIIKIEGAKKKIHFFVFIDFIH